MKMFLTNLSTAMAVWCSVAVALICPIITLANADGCNEFVCGSVVSKCLLTQSCQCKLSDCFCCKDCLNCLGELYTECCSCLDMCPKHNDTLSALAPKSQIGDFEGVPEYFDALTAVEDENQWTTIRFPMRNSLQRHYNMATGTFGFGSPPYGSGDAGQETSLQNIPTTVNCTVIFLNNCMNNKKCSDYCESMVSVLCGEKKNEIENKIAGACGPWRQPTKRISNNFFSLHFRVPTAIAGFMTAAVSASVPIVTTMASMKAAALPVPRTKMTKRCSMLTAWMMRLIMLAKMTNTCHGIMVKRN